MRHPPSLKSRFQLLALLAAGLPLFLIGGFLTLYLHAHFEQEIESRSKNQARQVLEEIDEYLAVPVSTLAAARSLVESGTASAEHLQIFFARTVRESPFLDALVLIDPQGDALVSAGVPPAPPTALDAPKPFVITGKSPAVVEDLEHATVTYTRGQTGAALPLLLDCGQDRLIGYANLDFLGQAIAKSAESGTVIRVYDSRDTLIAATEERKSLPESEYRSTSYPERKSWNVDSGKFNGSELHLAGLDWTIRVEQDNHLLGPVRHVGQVVLVGMGLAFLFAMVTIRPAINRLLHPLEVLQGRVREFAGSVNFNNRLPENSYREINNLFKGFDYLSKHLEARQNAMNESKEWYKMLFEASEDAVFVLNLNEDEDLFNILEANRSACELAGYSLAQLSFMTLEDLGLTESAGSYERMLHQLFRNKKVLFEESLRAKDGREIPMEFHLHLIENPGHRYVLAIGRDITERKKAAEKIEKMAFYDTLTGLPNRRLLMDRLNRIIYQAQRQRALVAVLFIDLDHFKRANDELGHEKGDELLVRIARRLEGTIRKNDTVARLGGDEFLVVLGDLHRAYEATEVADKIIHSLTEPLRLGTDQVFVGCSIGISVCPQDSSEGEELIRFADLAMYHVKQNGRNGYSFFSPGMNTVSENKKRTIRLLQDAVDRQAFSLLYQPKMTLDPVGIVGIEAFLRWQDPQLNRMALRELIKLAEETGLIVPIGNWVIDTACRKCRELQDLCGKQMVMTVNISPVQVQQLDFVENVAAALEKNGLPPESLDLDLPETILSPQFARYLPTLEQLKRLGVRLSLDGLGASLGYIHSLKSIPLHTLKFHRGFLDGLFTEPIIADAARAMIALAHSLGLEIVAEGIEAQDQLSFLRDEKCDQAQGYIFARPMTAEDLLAFLRSESASAEEDDQTPQ